MRKEKSKKDLIEFIKKEISYDAGGGLDCPYCGRNIQPCEYWISYKATLAMSINAFLGFKRGSWDDNHTEGMIFKEVDGFKVTRKKELDAENLGEKIWNLFYD